MSSLVLIWDFDEPLVEDVDVGATVDDGAVVMPEGSAPLPMALGADVVVVPLVVEGLEVVRTELGTPGSEPGSNAKSSRSTTMTKPDAIPIPFCRRRIFTFFISYPHFWASLVSRPYVLLYPFMRCATEFRGHLGEFTTLGAPFNPRFKGLTGDALFGC